MIFVRLFNSSIGMFAEAKEPQNNANQLKPPFHMLFLEAAVLF